MPQFVYEIDPSLSDKTLDLCVVQTLKICIALDTKQSKFELKQAQTHHISKIKRNLKPIISLHSQGSTILNSSFH